MSKRNESGLGFSVVEASGEVLDRRLLLTRWMMLHALILVFVATLTVPAAAAPATLRISETSPFDGNPSKSVTLNCPEGKRLVGAGAGLNGGGPDVTIYQITPNAALSGLTVRAKASADPSWSVTGFGVCTSINLPGLERQMFITGSDSQTSKSATAECSAGKRLLGAGGLISGTLPNVVIDDILPHSTLDKVTVWGVEGQGGQPDSWSLTAIAICAGVSDSLVSRVMAESPSDSTGAKSVTAKCPQGTVLFGTGAELVNLAGQGKFDAISPNGSLVASPSANTARASEDQDGTNENWRVRSYAICFALPVT